MDKKNLTIGILLLAVAFSVMFYTGRQNAANPPVAPAAQPVTSGPQANPATNPNAQTSALGNTTFAALATEAAGAQEIVLSNEYIDVRLTDRGGAIKHVAFKKYAAVQGQPQPFLFNEPHVDPLLAFTSDSLPGLDRNTTFQLVSSTSTEALYRAVYENRVEVFRRYRITTDGTPSNQGDPYQIRHEIIFRNLTDQTVTLPGFGLALGTVAPVNAADIGTHLSTGYRTGDDSEFIKRSKLEGGGFLGFGSSGPLPFIETPAAITWASVQNQFFVSILTPDSPGRSLITRRVELPPLPGTNHAAVGITGSAYFEAPSILPNGEKTLGYSLYAGPKEYPRVSNSDVFKHDQDDVMEYGMFSFFAKLLISMMSTIHRWVGDWGVAIILTTLTLKLIFLPLTLSASKSAKRMQKVQPQIAALREKYKDNPQKMNQATLELFREQKVNPFGGCLPILVTIPFFIGFYSMLQSTAELRFASFLWAHDLSVPDTVARVWGFPINIMPVLMGATMIFQMRLTPQPTVDNAQAKIFKLMPWIFTIFCYNFPAAIALYSTINGLFTIGQQLIINRMKDDEIASPGGNALRTASSGAKTVKNVTPKKKS